ncbi:MAG: transglutaminase-like domain-containing protein [Chloroflexota bacterium]
MSKYILISLFVIIAAVLVNINHAWTSPATEKILLDQGHGNGYTLTEEIVSRTTGRTIQPYDGPIDGVFPNYDRFMQLLVDAGYIIETSKESTITSALLEPYAAYVMIRPLVSLSADETSILQAYVVNGGSLLLLGDIPEQDDSGAAVRGVIQAFGAIMNNDIVRDVTNSLAEDTSYITYNSNHFPMPSHAILQGISTIQTYAASSMEPNEAIAMTTVIESGAQAIPANKVIVSAYDYALGRVVVMGDADLFATTFFDNDPGITRGDNEQFALNIIQWLLEERTTPDPSPIATSTPTVTSTASVMPTPTTESPTEVSTVAATATSLATGTATATAIATATPADTMTATSTPTATPPPSATPTSTATATLPPPPAQVTPSLPMPAVDVLSDTDGDGLLNITELNGWSNVEGTFTTNIAEADSDFDGLDDGEENLYNTSPLDERSPGIYVRYEESMQTKEYVYWEPVGTTYIGLTGAVVRRGSRFTVNGPQSATLDVQKSVPSLTDLTPIVQSNTSGASWTFDVGLANTVGEYTMTVRKGDWSKSLKLYVIFELPQNMTVQARETYLYNDDPFNRRDETSVWFSTLEEYDDPANREVHRAIGFGIGFQNDQYLPYVFEQAIRAVNGSTDPTQAAVQLANWTDSVTRFDPTRYSFNMYEVVYAPDQRNQCSNIGAALTSFSRSVGIPARLVMVDWDGFVVGSGYYDHATEVWLNGEWLTMRGYNVATGGEDINIVGGIVPPTALFDWGLHYYPSYYSDVLVTAGDSWDFNHLNSSARKAYVWETSDPFNIQRGEWLVTQHTPYWGWQAEPVFGGVPVATSRTDMPTKEEQGTPIATFTDSFADRIIDSDGDGQADELAITGEVIISATNEYLLLASLADANGNTTAKSTAMAISQERRFFEAGTHAFEVRFSGQDIFANGVSGNYLLRDLIISNPPRDNPTAIEINEYLLDSRHDVYTTQAYDVNEFETSVAYLVGDYSDFGIDQNNDGRFESLAVNIDVGIAALDIYTVTGELVDQAGTFIATGLWVGSIAPDVAQQTENQSVQLLFASDAINRVRTGEDSTFTLRNVRLSNSNNVLVDVDRDGYVTEEYRTEQFAGKASLVTPTLLDGSIDYQVAGQDTNRNGQYDYLQLDVDIQVAEAGTYQLEGWLADADGNLVTWATTDGLALNAGSHTLPLRFDGITIYAHGANSTIANVYRGFHLLNLTITAVSSENGFEIRTVVDTMEMAELAQGYQITDFESGTVPPDSIELKQFLPLIVR